MGFFEDIIDEFKFSVLKIRNKELEDKMQSKKLRDKMKSQKLTFIDFSDDTLNETFAKFIYKMYLAYAPLGKLLSDDINNAGLSFPRMFISYFVGEEKILITETFAKEAMRERIKKGDDINTIFAETKEAFNSFKNNFNPQVIEKVNKAYNNLKNLAMLNTFDFYLCLKSFDVNMVENDTSYKPSFMAKEAKALADDLIKLDCAIHSFDITKDMLEAIELYIGMKNAKNITKKEIKQIIDSVRYLKQTEVLKDMIIYILGDWSYESLPTISNENICVSYINDMAKQLKEDMDGIVSSLKEGKKNKLVEEIFGETAIMKMSEYNETKNEQLRANRCVQFRYIEALEYLKTFVIEKYERYMKEAYNTIMIESKYVEKDFETKISDGYYACNEIRDKLVKFDALLSENSEDGKRFRHLISGIRKNKANVDLLATLTGRMDAFADTLLKNSLSGFYKLYEMGLNIYNDCKDKTRKTVFNGADLASSQKDNLKVLGKSVVEIKKFLLLMKGLVK